MKWISVKRAYSRFRQYLSIVAGVIFVIFLVLTLVGIFWG
jgi:hypothetical protein